jgi:hypothetical protein
MPTTHIGNRVVAGRVVLKAVVVVVATIELRIGGVLGPELQIDPRSGPGLRLVERDPIGFDKKALLFGLPFALPVTAADA